jgi:hypothetical protein
MVSPEAVPDSAADGEVQTGGLPFRTAWWQRLLAERATYELTRFAVLRLLALVYLVGFVSLARQLDPLLGARGLLPVSQYLDGAHARIGVEAYWRLPTLFWLGSSDGVMHAACWAGVLLSAAALLGVTNALVQLALWVLYMSFVHVGQIFYGYGWEIQLLETGFLAVFLCPVRSIQPLPATPVPRLVVWLLRWLVFRVMLGAALIKLRGDECWRDLTCLDFHFETQPNPNPLALWLHAAPHWVHVVGLLFNHFCELVVPWFAFGPRRWRHAAGALLVAFQGTLILSGNLSFLNWLTIVPALACFDDSVWLRVLPARLRAPMSVRFEALVPTLMQRRVALALGVVVGVLSVFPVLNLVSGDQRMNASFEPLDLVNTYGAFGSVDRERYEVILEGTSDEEPTGARWLQYELPCMPGDLDRRPCIVTPYHYRLDWQMWFVGNAAPRGEPIDREPWLVHLVWQLLEGDASPKSLLARDPFPVTPPRWVRAGIWRYQFAVPHRGEEAEYTAKEDRFGDSREEAGRWWIRQRVGEFLPPVSREHPALRRYVRAFGW